MRFHVLAVPHTITNKNYVACAFTQKVLKFCAMMTARGHHVFHYGHPDSDVECTEHVNVVTRETFNSVYGGESWKTKSFEYDLNDAVYREYNENAIREVSARRKYSDFVLAFWGQGNKAVCDALQGFICVEPGIGYSQAFAPCRVYESYALLHANLGLERVQNSCNMPWYHVVIPNYFDPKDFEFSAQKKDYFLYLGRITRAKGLDLAIQATAAVGVRLVIAGQGGPGDLGLSEWPSHVEYVGYADAEKRRELLKWARGLFVLSTYVEPFAGVMIESFFSGTPVISTDWGTFAENNLHGITGFRCRTFGHMVWAAKNIFQISPEACRQWAQNFTLEKVAPMYEEYFRSILRGWYWDAVDRIEFDSMKRTYPKVQDTQTVDAIFPCFEQVWAAEKSLESYRRCYPNGRIMMMCDGGDPNMAIVAAKFGADYSYHENIGICHWKDPYAWLERFFSAVHRVTSEFFVMHEEDVLHVRPVRTEKLKWDICGTNPWATFSPELAEFTGQTYYAGSGGCFFRTDFFKQISVKNWRSIIDQIPSEWLHADIVLSVLTYKFGGQIGYSSECIEIDKPEFKTCVDPAVIHQHKAFYETPLCRLAWKYKADKTPRISHKYTPAYHEILKDIRASAQNILEIGIGNSDLMIPISGDEYVPGASLRMWRDYFPNATVYGCDILESVLFEDERIKTFWVDQSSEEILKERVPELEFDMILDDGSHLLPHMITSFKALWSRVKPGGYYIIEDMAGAEEELKKLAPVYASGSEFIVFKKPTKKILWVTAFRDIQRASWTLGEPRTNDEYFECFARLVEPLGPENIVCFIDDGPIAERVRALGVRTFPLAIEDTYVPKYLQKQTEVIARGEFQNLLPENLRTCQEYTNPLYGLTLYSKQCFVRRASEMFSDPTHFGWIDFGYAKSDAVAPKPGCEFTEVPDDRVFISSFRRLEFDDDNEPIMGVFGQDTLEGSARRNWNNGRGFLRDPFWAIQGNVWIVPRALTKWLEQAMDHSIERQLEAGIVLGHDEPVWLSIVHDFRPRFKIHVKAEWQGWDWL